MAELMEGGQDTLAGIARTRVKDIRNTLSVDRLSREPVRAELRARIRIRQMLAMFDYPPEEEGEAVDLVLKQMEIVAALWGPGGSGAARLPPPHPHPRTSSTSRT
ncbi:type I restriction enzyme endonuclease domain-containing protein [Streptomyces sp. bgisy159]|uniref:type I restriction enzyme endonuclease domain-containing protein n=1 Tax=Streptomyces sp. bgisy159 TaxID=3413795 RepID=UPI003F4A4EB6